MVTPVDTRDDVASAFKQYCVSQRRACTIVQIERWLGLFERKQPVATAAFSP
jgi:hypothetical protein